MTDGRIVALAATEEERQHVRKSAARVVDFGDHPLCPAWVNGHSHLAMAPLRGITSRRRQLGNVVTDVFFAIERCLRPEDVRAFSTLGAYDALLSGVAEVWDHYYFGRSVAEGFATAGITAVVAPTLQDVSGPFAGAWESALLDTIAIAESRALADAGISAAVGPHAADTVSPRLLTEASTLGRRMSLPLHMHYLQSLEEVHALEARGEPAPLRTEALLDRARGTRLVVAHVLHAGEVELARLAEAGAVLAFCPLSQVQFGFLGPALEFERAGGALCLGTDSVASNDGVDVSRELALALALPSLGASFGPERRALLARGDSASSLAVETRRKNELGNDGHDAARAWLGRALGYELPNGPRGITVGARANFMVFDARSPALFGDASLERLLMHGALGGALRQVIANGRPIGEEGHLAASVLRSDAYRDALMEARARAKELWARAGQNADAFTSVARASSRAPR